MTKLAIANNTISILVTGFIAEQVKDKMKLSKPRVVSVLDIFASVI